MLLRLTSYLAKRMTDRSPWKVAHTLWDILRNSSTQLRIIRVLTQPEFGDLARSSPPVLYKYTRANYLARGLTLAQRASCQLRHYGYLRSCASGALLNRILCHDITIFETHNNGIAYDIMMGLSNPFFYEGEMLMNFRVDEVPIFAMGFTIVPGRIFGSKAADAILISCLQGTKGSQRQLFLASKALHKVSPARLLVAALQGIAEALGILELAGVCATNHRSYCEDDFVSFKKAYDDLFVSLGATMGGTGYYCIPLPLPEKPLDLVQPNHRWEARQRRSFKNQVTEDVRRLLAQESICKSVAASHGGLLPRLGGTVRP